MAIPRALLVLPLAFSPLAAPPAREAASLARLFPGETIGFFAGADRLALRSAWADSPWAAILAEPEVHAWLAPLAAQWREWMESMRGEVGFDVPDLLDAFEGGFALALTHVDPGAETFAVSLAVECGRRRDRFAQIVEGLLEKLGDEASRSESTHAGVTIVRLDPGEEEGDEDLHLRYALAGSTFLAVVSNVVDDGLEGTIDRALGGPLEGSLATNSRFRLGLEKTGDGLFVGFLDLGRLLLRIGEAEPEVQRVLDAAGVEVETAVTGSHAFGAGGSRTAVYLDGARSGLLSLLQMPSGRFRLLEEVPRGVASVGAFHFDPKRGWETAVGFLEAALPEKERRKARVALQQFEAHIGRSIGEDLLGSLGDEVCVYTLPAQEGDEILDEDAPFGASLDRTVALATLRRPQAIEAHLEAVLRNVGLGATMRTDVISGRRVRSFVCFMMPCSFGAEGDVLAVSTNPERVAQALSLPSADGFASIEADPRFTRALASLPAGRATLSFSDTRIATRECVRMFSEVEDLLDQISDPPEPHRVWLALVRRFFAEVPPAEVFERHLLRDSASALVPEGDGILHVSVGP
jgi:hypothetical protein